MGELKEPQFIPQEQYRGVELYEGEGEDEDDKFIREYFESRMPKIEKEGDMVSEKREEAEKRGKGRLWKKTVGSLAGLTLLGVINAAPVHAGSDVVTKTIGRVIERIIGAWEKTDIEKERTRRENERQRAETEREKERAEEKKARERERTEQIKTRTGGDIVETKIEEEEKTERERIKTGVEEHEKAEKTGISGPFGDIRTDGTVISKEKSPPQQGEESMPSNAGSEKERIEKFKQRVQTDYLSGRPVGADIFKQFLSEERVLYINEWNRLENEHHKTGRYFRKNPKGGLLFGKPEVIQKEIEKKK